MTGLDGLNPDFRDIVALLCDEHAEFLIVGGFAVAFHGHPRATGDIDLLVRPSPENAERVFRALVRFGAPVRAAGLTTADLVRPEMVYQIGVPPRRIDVLTEITGVTFDDAWKTRVVIDWNGRTVGIVGLDALLANKLASGRPKDLYDVRELERVKARRRPR